ncbi:MAG TPA: M23 family peptidase [Bacillus bacterium]|uniref:L-Ala--D-Glu endopeptidase n=1 Tax=Siminovitchia fordii TaxID=254759 RepID=A0ABQ4K225_9BACI|nr:M23 family metallopeptidase [Siminovitchia fordii]GIN19824.1 L-Ala--D-Glu endopeptidase [Siminovitchia fordii]HBZ10909.1 M23 family peptidase [Bacillus sp. (in: firmicutes)]
MRIVLLFAVLIFFSGISVEAGEITKKSDMYEKRLELYKKTETATGVPWFYIAAVDQYERSIRYVRKDLPKPDGIIGIYIHPEQWKGIANPDKKDINPVTISFFNGLGQDGNGDGIANPNDEEDVLFTIGNYFSKYGVDDTRFRIALWNYYKRDKTVGAIMTNAKIYRKMDRIDLDDKAFPIPKGYNYTYHNTWGDRRGWGGRRMHEGTDIFAGYGAPVRAVAYGVVELKGWNKFGGWRVGIRDLNNTYHYYAHLNGFAKDLKIGKVVKPGDVIGSVGSSGYGPPGTAGKFPPHLHFGMYKDNGINEWAFDPYPHLKAWERVERK